MPSVSRPTPRRIAVTALVALSALMFLGCKGVTTIKALLDDPARYNGQTVRIMGDVEHSAGALGIGAYQINDGTGTMAVVSESGGAPREGARVGVEGTLRSAFTIGTKSATVLVEQRRYTP
jgi:hypothetical protein